MQNIIGKTLKLHRESRHMTQTELAKRLGVSQRNVSYYESGDRIPPADVLKKISYLFNITIDELVGVKKVNSSSSNCDDFFYEEGLANWNIRQKATSLNMTYEEVIEKSGIAKERFDLLWFGNVQPVAEELLRISQVLDVSIDYLLDNSKREKMNADEELILLYYKKYPEEIMNLLESFCSLDKKERTIILGKSLELERENISVAADEAQRTGTDGLGK